MEVCNENRVIDWEKAKVIDRESDKPGRHIREAIWIRKTVEMKKFSARRLFKQFLNEN